jgi:hypothetical protein
MSEHPYRVRINSREPCIVYGENALDAINRVIRLLQEEKDHDPNKVTYLFTATKVTD